MDTRGLITFLDHTGECTFVRFGVRVSTYNFLNVGHYGYGRKEKLARPCNFEKIEKIDRGQEYKLNFGKWRASGR